MGKHLLLLASEQVWPNVLGTLYAREYMAEAGEVKGIWILHTDARTSEGPARRLCQWGRQEFPETQVEMVGPVSFEPQQVTRAIEELMKDKDGEWIINATGGLKLMSLGVANLLPLPYSGSALRVIYREVNKWYELHRAPDWRIYSAEMPDDPHLADNLALEVLAELQQGNAWDVKQQDPIADRLPLDALVQKGIETSWKWSHMFHSLGLFPAENRHGFLFEQFIAGLLLELGVKNVAIGLQLKQEQLNELDVLCITQNKFLFFDCKLTTTAQSKEKLGESGPLLEINGAAQQLRNTGGLAAQGYLVRPSRSIPGVQKELAKTQRITVWDEADMWDIIALVSHEVGKPQSDWNDTVHESHRLLQAEKQARRAVISLSRDQVSVQQAAQRGSFLSLDSFAKKLNEVDNPGWSGFSMGGCILLILSVPTVHLPGSKLQDSNDIQWSLQRYGDVIWSSRSDKGASMRLFIRPKHTDAGKQLFEAFSKQSFNWWEPKAS